MFLAAQTMDFSTGESASVWASTLDRLIARTEAAEASLAHLGIAHLGDGEGSRKATGSFYTPADVADHAWAQFFHLHRINSPAALRSFIARTRLVEPSAGSGMFVLTFLRKALNFGLKPEELQSIRFCVIDVNDAALHFLRRSLAELEAALGIDLGNILLVQGDFLDWVSVTAFDHVAFVGNPPFVANPRGSRWRNLFADFIETMLACRCAERSIGLILPMSVCFSRDYAALRNAIVSRGLGISAASYDNIPDCLFKSGKPESRNTNKANSQRCTMLMLGGPDPALRRAASLLRWAAAERSSVLGALPAYHDFSGYAFDGQLPRPMCPGVMAYLAGQSAVCTIGDLVDRTATPIFAIAAVARNFIGIRDVDGPATASMAIAAHNRNDEMILLQVLASPAFYEYWRTLGDGFHVTRDLVMRFPLSEALLRLCADNLETAETTWKNKANFAREKLNNGKIVRSYDFRNAFRYIDFAG